MRSAGNFRQTDHIEMDASVFCKPQLRQALYNLSILYRVRLQMSPLAFLMIGLGAAAGAWLRWLLSIWINPFFPTIPLGTLAANLLGGYLMGVALGAFQHWPALSPELRLLITTGFLGGLTTFSTFSAETTTLLLRQQYAWCASAIVMHVAGSLLMTWLGLLSINHLLQRG